MVLCYSSGTGGEDMSRPEQKENARLNAAGISYADLIRSRRRQKGLNQEELGALVSVGKNAVGAWEAGRSRPDLASVPVICEALGLTLEEFYGYELSGKDQQVPENNHAKRQKNEKTAEFVSQYLELTEDHRKIVLHVMEDLLLLQGRTEKPARKLIRIYRNNLSACAGPSYTIGESMGEPVWIEETPLTCAADELIRVSGDSMEPEFHDGDQVLVQHGASLRPGDIGIFVNGDAGYIKEYQRDGLHSLNPAYATMHFHEGDDVRCIGKVLGIAADELFAREDEIRDQDL